MRFKILYEDADILAIDKPSGISVHPDGRTSEKTITDWVMENYPEMKDVGEPITVNNVEVARPGIVHRLDKETSGVLLLAKNQKAHQFLKQQFQNHEVRKIYHAIVSGNVKKDHDVIDKPIGRSPSDFRRRLAGRGARGEMREAVTEYKVLKRFEARASMSKGSPCSNAPFTYLEVSLKTGRTHQIRVHMKYINHPVVCDSLYNPDKPCPEGLNRLALHAKSNEFSTLGGSLPVRQAGASGGKNLAGETVKVESPLPREFEKVLK